MPVTPLHRLKKLEDMLISWFNSILTRGGLNKISFFTTGKVHQLTWNNSFVFVTVAVGMEMEGLTLYYAVNTLK